MKEINNLVGRYIAVLAYPSDKIVEFRIGDKNKIMSKVPKKKLTKSYVYIGYEENGIFYITDILNTVNNTYLNIVAIRFEITSINDEKVRVSSILYEGIVNDKKDIISLRNQTQNNEEYIIRPLFMHEIKSEDYIENSLLIKFA